MSHEPHDHRPGVPETFAPSSEGSARANGIPTQQDDLDTDRVDDQPQDEDKPRDADALEHEHALATGEGRPEPPEGLRG